MHGNHVDNQAAENQAIQQEDADRLELRAVGGVHIRHLVVEADQGKAETCNQRCERGDQLVDQAEQRSHQTGNISAASIGLIVGAVCRHRDDNRARHVLKAAGDNGEHKECHREEGKAVEALISWQGKGRRISEDPEQDHQDVAQDGDLAGEHHGLLLPELRCDDADAEQDEDHVSDGGVEGEPAGERVVAGHNAKHDQCDRGGLGRIAELICRGGEDQHLNRLVVLDNIKVVAEGDLLRHAVQIADRDAMMAQNSWKRPMSFPRPPYLGAR